MEMYTMKESFVGVLNDELFLQEIKEKRKFMGCQIKFAVLDFFLKIIDNDSMFRVDFNAWALGQRGIKKDKRNLNYMSNSLEKMLTVYFNAEKLGEIKYIQMNKIGVVPLKCISMEVDTLANFNGMKLSTESEKQSIIDEIIFNNRDIMYINLTEIKKENILEEMAPEQTTCDSFYINKSYCLMCLREYEAMNCDSFWGLNPLITFAGGYKFKSDFEVDVFYWGLLALECKAVVVGEVDFSELVDKRIGRGFAAINVEKEKQMKIKKLWPWQKISAAKDEFIGDTVSEVAGVEIKNAKAFYAPDLWDAVYENYLRSKIEESNLNYNSIKMAFKIISPDENENSEKQFKGINSVEQHRCYDKNCRVNTTTIKNDQYLNTLGNFKDGGFDSKWFGSAPFCDPNMCDLYEEGYMPFYKNKKGDGKSCWTGKKILGVKPKMYTEEGMDTLKKAKLKCEDFRIAELGTKVDPVKSIIGGVTAGIGALGGTPS